MAGRLSARAEVSSNLGLKFWPVGCAGQGEKAEERRNEPSSRDRRGPLGPLGRPVADRARPSVTVHEAGPAAAAAAGRISTRNSACASTTATTCCCRATRRQGLHRGNWRRRTGSASLDRAVFPFMDLKTGERWTVRPNNGRIPWWVFCADRRVPETRLSDYLAMARIARIRDDTTVADSMRRGRLYWRLAGAVAVAALNTPPRKGSPACSPR